MNWIYKEEEVTELPNGYYGFIYLIEYENGMKYIGMKSIMSEQTLPALKSGQMRDTAYKQISKNVLRDENGNIIVSKKGKAAARKKGLKAKRELYDVIAKESDWRSYTGSLKLEDLPEVKSKTILKLCESKRSLTYYEVKYLFLNDVLANPEFYNSNIGGVYFPNSL